MRLLAVPLLVLAIPAAAHGSTYPTPGTPRTKDGNPNLSAPTPWTEEGKPDLTGIWAAPSGKYLEDLGADEIEVPIQPWAAALYEQHRENDSKGRPFERCISPGLPDYDALPLPHKLVQTPGAIVVIYEAFNHPPDSDGRTSLSE
jgi:hypothetical protein